MHHAHWDGRVLSVYATGKGLAFAVFEGPLSTVDWGIKQVREKQKNPAVLKAVGDLIERWQPDTLIIEQCAEKGNRRSPRIRRLYRAIAALGRSQCLEVHCYSRAQVRQCFDERFGASTKPDIARAICGLLPEFAHRLPPVRKPWMGEHSGMGIFSAAALVFAFFRFGASPDA